MIRTSPLALVMLVAASGLSGCSKKESSRSSAPAGESPPPPAVTAPKIIGSANGMGVPAVAPKPPATPPPAGDLKSLLAGPASSGIKDSETIVGAGGVVLGFPAKWTSGNIYDAQTSYGSPDINASTKGVSILCQTTTEKLDMAAVHSTAYAAQIQKETWTEEVDGVVGVESYPAKLGRGTGQQVAGMHVPVTTYYVHTAKIPGAKPILCAGGFPTSHPELEKELIEAFKGMKNSKAKK